MTDVEICSAALEQLGDSGITGFDDGTTKANLCKRFYSIVRDAVLRAYPWNCAKFRKAMSPLAETPATGGDHNWAYQYSLPQDPFCLWVPKSLNEDLEYKIENRRLLTDESTVTIVYIGQITATGDFDTLLVEAIIARLASQLAYPITKQMSLAQEMWKLYAAKLREARTADGQEGTLEAHDSSTLIDVR